tara:strand:+ start:4245 stop:4556 length:312 start_codon:yes stop_codon:yes gene_type:complete
MELLEIENLNLESNNLTAVFDGLFTEGFVVKTEFSYDEETIEEEEEETNCKEILAPTNLNFWDFKTYDSDENEISINDRELKKIKELVEFKLIDELSNELNNK